MKSNQTSDLLRNESRLLELRRVTRSLEQRRLALASEKEWLSTHIEKLLAELAET